MRLGKFLDFLRLQGTLEDKAGNHIPESDSWINLKYIIAHNNHNDF